MASVFEVGKTYSWYAREYDFIKVMSRTPKTIVVTTGDGVHMHSWRMRIKHDENGNEFVADSTVPKKWRDVFTCSAEWVEEGA